MATTAELLADPARLTAAEAVRRIARGDLDVEALVRACLERIEAREPTIEAWAHLDPDAALAMAQHIDRLGPSGPLYGLPAGVKDTFDTADQPTGYGSPLYQGHRPQRDSGPVAALREAGAMILGKTVTTEFAYRTPGPTRNPHNPGHTPGGSSSGSAAAVADFMVPLALGSQTGGSMIRPAAFCGVFALKPTYGFVSTDGVHPLAMALDTVGWFGRSIDDLALAGAVLSTAQSAQLDPLVEPPRIGVVRTADWGRVSEAARRALEGVAAGLISDGAVVDDLGLPVDWSGLGEAWETMIAAGAASAFAEKYCERREGISRPLRELVESGQALSSAQRSEAESFALQGRATVSELFAEYDAFLTPSSSGEAPPGMGSTGDPLFNRLWTLLRLPCVAIPVATGIEGLPVGVQLVGRHGGDQSLLEVASYVATVVDGLSHQ